MNKIKECIKANKRLCIGALGVLVLAILIVIIVCLTSNKKSDTEQIITSNTQVVAVHETLSQLDFKRETLDKITSCITSGKTGVYTVDNKHFAILTTGGQSATDIEYKTESSTDGKLNIYYRLSDTPDGNTKVRYKIIELTSPDINIIEESNTNDETKGSGFARLLIFNYNNEVKIYSIDGKQIITGASWDTDGAYMGEFKDGELVACSSIDSVTVKDCIIKDKVSQSKNLYHVELPSKDTIQVYIDNSNLEIASTVALKIGYSNKLSGFTGEVTEGV